MIASIVARSFTCVGFSGATDPARVDSFAEAEERASHANLG
jgi:hypothetical protein